jgi:3'-phosphoadenosine 5'-phosphosulfate sulfotransferase (PAPS reductase)/FAD synthetase
MVLTDLILKAGNIGIFSLETGRLHKETGSSTTATTSRCTAAAEAVEAYVAQNGLNAFYDSVEMRKECCRIRKVEPLGRALAGNKAWVTGQRRAQAATRASLQVEEDDGARHDQVQSAGRLVGGRRLGLHPRQRRAVQRAARPGLPVHRLRAVYPRHPARRRCPRRPLVVGNPESRNAACTWSTAN